MDRKSTPTQIELKHILRDENVEPKALPLSLLEEITNSFSEEREIGRGGSAVVYKGMLDNGEAIAVKRLSHTYKYEKQFNREVECLIRVKHKNVVRFIGYCVDSQGKADSYKGKFVMADVLQKLLCFEYLPHGTLNKYITDASCGLEWTTRYRIINGICDGLHYLHQNHVLHLDLKPPNILLDGNMLPKIADFGLSRCFDENQSRASTTSIGGTMGYLAPEFGSRKITYRFDLYSLGVIIIEILTGKRGYEDVDNVLGSWSSRLERSHRDIQLEQVRVCTEIGLECIESNPEKRPVSMQHIIARLHEMGNIEVPIETAVTRSSALQAQTDSDDPHQGAPKAPAGTSSETRSVSGLVDEVSSMAVSAASSDQPWRTSAPKGQGETSTEDCSFPGSSTFLLDRAISVLGPEVLQVAVTKISSILTDEASHAIISNYSGKVKNLKEFPEKCEQIRRQLIIMSNFIREISMDEVTKIWIMHVRKVACHVEDLMDKYSYHVLKLQHEGWFWKRLFTGGTSYFNVLREIVDEVVELEKEILQVIQMKNQWPLRSQNVSTNILEEMERTPSADSFPKHVKHEDLVGMEGMKTLLTGWLYPKQLDEQDCTVITVYGTGGLGKTSLVSNVYEREKNMFPAHAWIIVSKTYTVEDLLRKLLSKIGYTEQTRLADMDANGLKEKIKEKLKGRKCFIVLDDVWEREAYTQIHITLCDLQEARIVITTRNKHVAALALPTHRLELQPLGKAASFNLFCRKAFYNCKNNHCPSDLKQLAESITDRCQGVPLAIISIGSMLSTKKRTQHVWNQTLNQLRSELSKNDDVQAILYLSYCDLPEDLRNCFLYCSLFPKDYPMPQKSLVWLWVAEGFAVRHGHRPEDVAEGNLAELIHRNLLELVETDELGRVRTCKMLDIVHELALSVAKKEMFVSANDSATILLMNKEVRRLSTFGWQDKTASRDKFPRLRTIISVATVPSSTGILSSILSESSYLTVLELQDSEITEVPTSIGNLFNLRYIGLRRTRIKSIPESIGQLSNLSTLDIKQTKIEKLPQGITKVKKLRHLLVDRFAADKKTNFRYVVGMEAPTGLFNLEELQSLETVECSNNLAKQLKKLTRLRILWVDNINVADSADLFAALSNMPLLSSLVLSAKDENEALCFEALKPVSRHLLKLIVRGQWAKGTLNCPVFLGHGRNLRYLALSWCRLGEDPLGMLTPHMLNLTYLRLNNMHSANALVLSVDSFPNLKTLILKHMPDVSEINIIDGALPCIEGFYIVSLSKLDKVPQGIESLQSLEKLWLIGLHEDFRSRWDTNGMHEKMLHVPEVRV